MNRVAKHRELVGQFAIIAMMICGAGAGYLLGCGLALIRATILVDDYAKLMAVKENASLDEAQSALRSLNDSRYPTCSEGDIAAFRDLVFRSNYLKDAGRMKGSKIDCSAAEGRLARPIDTFKQESVEKNGIVAYSSFSPIEKSSPKRRALRLGNAFVVIGTIPPPNLGPVPIQLTATMKDDANPQRGRAAGGTGNRSDSYLFTDGIGHQGDRLYTTRCSTLQLNCVTAFTSIHGAIYGAVDLLASTAVAGGLAGISLGMVFSLLYKRSRNREQQLRRAVQNEELQVVYQPVVDLETHQIVGAEALARWTDEEGNEVKPDEFVKLAEDRGFVGGITRTVLRRILCDFAMTLHSRPGFRISMNVAAADLADPEFLPLLEGALQRAKVNPQSLIIEITERSAADSPEAMETIRNLRRMGHSIHIDDFGTGYSNLDKLLYLFADTIKIDKAFTGVIGTDSMGAAILPQILKMAKSLNLEVVVEGVETVHQADYFTPGEQKIYAQGWLYGRPMSAEEFVGALSGNQAQVPDAPDLDAAFTTKPGTLRVVGSAA